MGSDPNIPRPDLRREQDTKATVSEMEGAPRWAVAIAQQGAETQRAVTSMGTELRTLTHDFVSLKQDVRILQARQVDEDHRRTYSVQPAPINSDFVRDVIERSPSKMDLETKAAVMTAETRIAETHDAVQSLKADAVTKADVKKAVEDATALQTAALVTSFSKNRTVKLIAGLAGAAILGWLGSCSAAKAPAPAAAQVVYVPVPALSPDAGTR